jgi:hypothetical protein
MALTDDLVRIAEAASTRGEVEAVLAAEPAGAARVYLVSLGGAERRWLVLDDQGVPVDERARVREAASIVALCEVAADIALELGGVAGEPPRLATPAYLDEVGAAAGAAFADGLRFATAAVDEFVRDVELGYLVPLR